MPVANVNIVNTQYSMVRDYDDSLQIFREALQNSVDAIHLNANNLAKRKSQGTIYVHVHHLDNTKLAIDILDNGIGITDPAFFFDIGNSSKKGDFEEQRPPLIGHKGHGAKIFFYSEEVKVFTKTDNKVQAWKCTEPLKINAGGGLSLIEYDDIDENGFEDYPEMMNEKSGTMIRIIEPKSFNSITSKKRLQHIALRDYIKFFTVFGDVNVSEDINNDKPILFLRGIDTSTEYFQDNFGIGKNIEIMFDTSFQNQLFKRQPKLYEKLLYGHYFPAEAKTRAELRRRKNRFPQLIDKEENEFYTFKADITTLTPEIKIILSVEALEVRKLCNPLLSKQGRASQYIDREITYSADSRFGIWACKDGIPICKIDEWWEEKGGRLSYLKCFVNCDDFSLTSSRSDVKNTSPELIGIIKDSINSFFSSVAVQNVLDERGILEEQKKFRQKKAKDEQLLRKRSRNNREYAKVINSNTIYTPNLKMPFVSRSGVASEIETMILFSQLQVLHPDIFLISTIDYNTNTGLDCVVSNNGAYKYLEFKGTLKSDMNHSLELMSFIVCWDVLSGLTTVEDLDGKRYSLESRSENIQLNGANYQYTHDYLYDSSDPSRTEKIRLIILKKYLFELRNILGFTFN